tara:strand:+ start:449 stop:613 length:165 start_codon:yes stop_codon:yes gene_type:complete
MSKGLGDTIEKITTFTGIKWIVKKISKLLGIDCGCDFRRKKLNKLVPYKEKSDV